MSNRYLTTPCKVLVLFLACVSVAVAYQIQQGETLGGLSQRWYGTPTYWEALKWYSGIGNERTIPVGTNILQADRATIERVKQILASTTNPAERSQQIAGLGGTATPAPTPPRMNEGLGRPVSYDFHAGLSKRTIAR